MAKKQAVSSARTVTQAVPPAVPQAVPHAPNANTISDCKIDFSDIPEFSDANLARARPLMRPRAANPKKADGNSPGAEAD